LVKNLLALLYVALSWGSAFALIKYAEETISPLTVQAGRCTIGFIALLILAIVSSAYFINANAEPHESATYNRARRFFTNFPPPPPKVFTE